MDDGQDGVASGRRPLGTWRARAGFEPSGKGNGHGWFHRSLQRPGVGVMRAETVAADDTRSWGALVKRGLGSSRTFLKARIFEDDALGFGAAVAREEGGPYQADPITNGGTSPAAKGSFGALE